MIVARVGDDFFGEFFWVCVLFAELFAEAGGGCVADAH